MQLILAKDGYGYDILNFCRYVDDSFGIELNGKRIRKSTKWSLFVKYNTAYFSNQLLS
ncbi:MAG: hypothetical protein IJ916_01250 [Paludibacteraceae bacterium]|nr:hypothetical protein [Paludibacteraceae bacterium]